MALLFQDIDVELFACIQAHTRSVTHDRVAGKEASWGHGDILFPIYG